MKSALLWLLRSSLLLLFAGLVWGQTDPFQTAAKLLETGRVEEARKLLLDLLSQNPGAEPIEGFLGQIAFSQKNYAEAASRFRKAPSILAKNPVLSVNYAEALLETESLEAAKRELERLPRSDAAAQFESGLLLARAGDFVAAEAHFKFAREGYPNADVVEYNLALAQLHAQKYPECVTTLEQMRARGGSNSDVLRLLAEAYLEAGRPQKSYEVLQELIKDNPRDRRLYLLLTQLADQEDRADIGLEWLDYGLRYMPDSFPLLMQRGYLHLLLGRNKESESDYRKAIEIQPDSDSAPIELAFLLLTTQRYPEADKLLKQVIQSSPSNFFGYYLLGEIRLQEGLNEEALRYTKKAAALETGYAAIHANLGKLYVKSKEYAAAIRELEAAVKLDPDNKTAYYQLSIAYRKTGEKEKARAALVHVRRLNKQQRELGTARYLARKLRKADRQALRK